jgi:hypothetical protein
LSRTSVLSMLDNVAAALVETPGRGIHDRDVLVA